MRELKFFMGMCGAVSIITAMHLGGIYKTFFLFIGGFLVAYSTQ